MSNLLQALKPNYDGKLHGSVRTEVEKHAVLFFVNRVDDKRLVKKYLKDFDAKDVSIKHTIRKFGLKIDISAEGVNLYRNEDFPLSEGNQKWILNLKRKNDSVSILYAISVEVIPVETPTVVEFTAKTRIDAALAVYRERVAVAELELRKELERISSISINEAAPKQTKPSNLKTVKRKKLLKRD